jgi:hypothetical protein
MKIIDFHFHPISSANDFLSQPMELLKKRNPDWVKRFPRIPASKEILSFLDSQEIDCAVLLAERIPGVTGMVSNEYVAQLCKGEPRLIPFCSINPSLDTHLEVMLERLVDQGFKGLKLWPSYQHFYPNQPHLYPLYAAAQRLNVPILFHIGTSIFEGTKLKYCDPIYLDEVAVDFPRLNLVMAHAGRGFWYEKAFILARLHKNIYLEISGLPPRKLLTYFPQLEKIGSKIIFGSDYPDVASIKANVEQIKALPLDPSIIEGILGLHANRLLKVF